MNLRFVEALYWVATLKSVTRAAEKLCLTQSAMSSRVAALEDELGVMLLDRRERQFRLTIPGLRFFVHAQRMPMTASILSNGRKNGAFGLASGGNGAA